MNNTPVIYIPWRWATGQEDSIIREHLDGDYLLFWETPPENQITVVMHNTKKSVERLNMEEFPVSRLINADNGDRITKIAQRSQKIQLPIQHAVVDTIDSLWKIFEKKETGKFHIVCHSQGALVFMESVIQHPGLLEFIEEIELLSPSTGYDIEYCYDSQRGEIKNGIIQSYLHEVWAFLVSGEFLEEVTEKKEVSVFLDFIEVLKKWNYSWDLSVLYCPEDRVLNWQAWTETQEDRKLLKLDDPTMINHLKIASSSQIRLFYEPVNINRPFSYTIGQVAGWHNLTIDYNELDDNF